MAWGPYSVVSLISAFGDESSVPPLAGTAPALFAKSQVVWNPLIYVLTNKNFRQKMPFFNKSAREDSQYTIVPYRYKQLFSS